MKKKIICSSILLLFGGFITKLLGMFIKIMMSRNIGINGLSLYMLVLPTFSFGILLGQAGFSLTLSRMVAYKDKSISSIYSTVFIFLLVYNLIISIGLILLAPTISHTLLKNESAYLPIIGIALVIPFTTLSNTLKSYFVGIQKMYPIVLSNIIENILRLCFIIFMVPLLKNNSISFLVLIIILFNIISESISSLILVLFIKKRPKQISFNIKTLKEVVFTSLPQLLSTLIGNGTYFLEPIILFHMLESQYTTSFITKEYGIITGYVLPIVFLPLFFITTISQVLLPTITQLYKNQNKQKIISLLKQQSIITLLLSGISSITFYLFSKQILQLLYHTALGISYLKYLSFFIVFIYLEPIFQYLWIAMNKTKEIFIATIVSSIIRILSLFIFLQLNFGIDSLLLSLITNTILTTLFQYHRANFYLTKKEDFSSI